MPVRFCPIASGSSGNCIYVGSPETNILIDAGTSGVRIIEGLKKINVSPSDIDAVFITHEHSDHTKGAGIFSRRFNKPICATEGTWRGMFGNIGKVADENIRCINSHSVIKLNDMEIVPFDIPHDAEEPIGFSILSNGAKITIATDIGKPSDEIVEMLEGSDIVLLETNHDVKMLEQGSYPYYLKRRILSDFGHLSNNAAGELLSKVVSPRLKHVFLGHLSAENNTPRLAFDTVAGILKRNGKLNESYIIRCANRNDISALAEV